MFARFEHVSWMMLKRMFFLLENFVDRLHRLVLSCKLVVPLVGAVGKRERLRGIQG